MTYTVKQRDTHGHYVDTDGNAHPIWLWDCGHKHRSLRAAAKCLEVLSGTTRSIGAVIVDGEDEIIPSADYAEYR